jgi:hypothetical protein
MTSAAERIVKLLAKPGCLSIVTGPENESTAVQKGRGAGRFGGFAVNNPLIGTVDERHGGRNSTEH